MSAVFPEIVACKEICFTFSKIHVLFTCSGSILSVPERTGPIKRQRLQMAKERVGTLTAGYIYIWWVPEEETNTAEWGRFVNNCTLGLSSTFFNLLYNIVTWCLKARTMESQWHRKKSIARPTFTETCFQGNKYTAVRRESSGYSHRDPVGPTSNRYSLCCPSHSRWNVHSVIALFFVNVYRNGDGYVKHSPCTQLQWGEMSSWQSTGWNKWSSKWELPSSREHVLAR
jgi:hypothetical protein